MAPANTSQAMSEEPWLRISLALFLSPDAFRKVFASVWERLIVILRAVLPSPLPPASAASFSM